MPGVVLYISECSLERNGLAYQGMTEIHHLTFTCPSLLYICILSIYLGVYGMSSCICRCLRILQFFYEYDEFENVARRTQISFHLGQIGLHIKVDEKDHIKRAALIVKKSLFYKKGYPESFK